MANHSMPARGPGRGGPRFAGKTNMKALGRLIRLLFKEYPVMLTIVMVCIVISALIGVAPSVYIETITSYIEQGLTSGWDAVKAPILKAITTMIGLYVLGLISTTVYTQLMAHVTQNFLHKLRTEMFAGMQRLPIKFFDQNSRGDIMSYYTNDADTLRQLVSQALPHLFSSGLVVLSLLFIMFYYSMPLMLIIFAGIFFMFRATKTVGGKSASFFVRQQKLSLVHI